MKISNRFLTLFLMVFVITLSPTSIAQTQRKYYLTKTTVAANTAKAACATGYHMASIFEIEETASLRYETTLGQTSGDSGSGPPLGYQVWARTGLPGLNQSCNAWTSIDPSLTGYTFMLVYPNNVASREQFGHWIAEPMSCTNRYRVACVED